MGTEELIRSYKEMSLLPTYGCLSNLSRVGVVFLRGSLSVASYVAVLCLCFFGYL